MTASRSEAQPSPAEMEEINKFVVEKCMQYRSLLQAGFSTDKEMQIFIPAWLSPIGEGYPYQAELLRFSTLLKEKFDKQKNPIEALTAYKKALENGLILSFCKDYPAIRDFFYAEFQRETNILAEATTAFCDAASVSLHLPPEANIEYLTRRSAEQPFHPPKKMNQEITLEVKMADTVFSFTHSEYQAVLPVLRKKKIIFSEENSIPDGTQPPEVLPHIKSEIEALRKFKQLIDIPAEFICPITRKFFDGSVLLSPRGHYFNVRAILDYVRRYEKCPVTEEPLSIDMLKVSESSILLNGLISEFQSHHLTIKAESDAYYAGKLATEDFMSALNRYCNNVKSIIGAIISVVLIHQKDYLHSQKKYLLAQCETPKEFICPLTKKMFNHIVFTPQGHYFTLMDLIKHLRLHNACPISNNVLTISDLSPIHSALGLILHDFNEHRKKLMESIKTMTLADEPNVKQALAHYQQDTAAKVAKFLAIVEIEQIQIRKKLRQEPSLFSSKRTASGNLKLFDNADIGHADKKEVQPGRQRQRRHSLSK